MNKFQVAPLGVYIEWLRAHLNDETQPTHWYDYPYPARDFLMATADFTTGGECGVYARSILVSPGAHHHGGRLGYNKLYYFGEGPVPTFIPIYSNPEFLTLPGVVDFISEASKRDRAFWAERERMTQASAAERAEGDLGQYLQAWSAAPAGLDRPCILIA